MKKVVLFLVSIFLVFSFSSSWADSNYKKAMRYRYKLCLQGINYAPLADRLNDDIILMSKILSLGENDFNPKSVVTQILSTRKRTFQTKKKNLYINYMISSSDLVKLLFIGQITSNTDKVEPVYSGEVKSIERIQRKKLRVYYIEAVR